MSVFYLPKYVRQAKDLRLIIRSRSACLSVPELYISLSIQKAIESLVQCNNVIVALNIGIDTLEGFAAKYYQEQV